MASPELREEWERIQEQLRQRLVAEDAIDWSLSVRQPNVLQFVGGVDISFMESSDEAVACLVVLHYPDLRLVYEDFEHIHLTVPYMAGFLAFREALPFVSLMHRVKQTAFNPQVVLVDGNGMLHPRRFGSACHLGVASDYPTIGVAKTLHCIDGLDERSIKENVRNRIDGLDVGAQPSDRMTGDVMELRGNDGVLLGMAVFNHGRNRTRNPIYVSVGHRVSLETATDLIRSCALFRIPEPLRQADLRSRSYIRRYRP